MSTSVRFPVMAFWMVLSLAGCTSRDAQSLPPLPCDSGGMNVISWQEAIGYYNGEITSITDDVYIEGYVISSDQEDNIYGRLYIQNRVSDPDFGLRFHTDMTDLYLRYPVGSRVRILLKGLFLNMEDTGMVLGGLQESFGNYRIGNVPVLSTESHLLADCDPPLSLQPREVTVEALEHTPNFTFIKLKEVQALGKELCTPVTPEGESREVVLEDCDGNTLGITNSGYASFRSEVIPSGRGSITGILEKTTRKNKILISFYEDMSLEQPRCGAFVYVCEAPKVNTSIRELKQLMTSDYWSIDEDIVIEGTITANDSLGAFRERLVLEDSSGGILIRMRSDVLYKKGFRLGSTWKLRLKGLSMVRLGPLYEVGWEEEVAALPEAEWYRFFYKSNTTLSIDPPSFEISYLQPDLVGRSIKLEGVQFESGIQTLGDTQGFPGMALYDCNGTGLEVFVREASGLGEMDAPLGKGVLMGILHWSDGYVVIPRSPEDISLMTEDRCDLFDTATHITLSECKLRMETSEVVEENIYVQGTVTWISPISDFHQIIMEDESAAMPLLLHSSILVQRGERLTIWLRGAVLRKENNVTQPLVDDPNRLKEQVADVLPEGIHSIPGEEISEDDFYRRVYFTEVQLEQTSDLFEQVMTLTDCVRSQPLYVAANSDLLGDPVPEESVRLSGINFPHGLYLFSKEDLHISGPALDCRGFKTSNRILISEIADPLNTTTGANGRFTELYNTGSEIISLQGWSLRRFTNANPYYTESSIIWLDGYSIIPGGTLVVAAVSEEFSLIYGFPPDLSGGTGGASNSNGDDTIALYDGNGELVDIYGIPGVDGTGTFADFENGKAIRKTTVVQNSVIFNATEWEVYNEHGQEGSIVSPQTAPSDLSPSKHP